MKIAAIRIKLALVIVLPVRSVKCCWFWMKNMTAIDCFIYRARRHSTVHGYLVTREEKKEKNFFLKYVVTILVANFFKNSYASVLTKFSKTLFCRFYTPFIDVIMYDTMHPGQKKTHKMIENTSILLKFETFSCRFHLLTQWWQNKKLLLVQKSTY